MKRILVFLVLLCLVGGGSVLWWKNGLQSPNPDNKTQKIFVIQKGQSVREIGNHLAREGLIRDPVIFFLYLKKTGKDIEIQAGDYKLSPSMSLATLVDTLQHGTLDVWITFPEGLRAEEVAEILKKSLKTYQNSWKEKLVENEGYLFPDTYLIPKDAGVDLVISSMRDVFVKRVTAAGISDKGKEIQRIVTIASLIEREAKYPEDKPIVSSVIHNRLDLGMKLDIDATVQYALGSMNEEKTWWKKNLTYQDLQIESPYNTYRYAGLPPTPISNPGILSLKAAANPSLSNYRYYLSDMSGKLHFASDFREHSKNIEKYISTP